MALAARIIDVPVEWRGNSLGVLAERALRRWRMMGSDFRSELRSWAMERSGNMTWNQNHPLAILLDSMPDRDFQRWILNTNAPSMGDIEDAVHEEMCDECDSHDQCQERCDRFYERAQSIYNDDLDLNTDPLEPVLDRISNRPVPSIEPLVNFQSWKIIPRMGIWEMDYPPVIPIPNLLDVLGNYCSDPGCLTCNRNYGPTSAVVLYTQWHHWIGHNALSLGFVVDLNERLAHIGHQVREERRPRYYEVLKLKPLLDEYLIKRGAANARRI